MHPGHPQHTHNIMPSRPAKRVRVEERSTADCTAVPLGTHPPSVAQPIRFVDAFAGMGGFRHGLKALGWQCVFSIDADKKASATYLASFGRGDGGGDDDDGAKTHHVTCDIRDVPLDGLPDMDVLVGGFPCQPFSQAGVTKNRALGKDVREDHPLGNLVDTLLRWVEAKRPKACLFENVKPFFAKANTPTVDRVTEALKEAGYHLTTHFVNAAHWVPQSRERAFLIAIRADVGGPLHLDMTFLPPRPSVSPLAHFLEPHGEVCARTKISPKGIAGLLGHKHGRLCTKKDGTRVAGSFGVRILSLEDQHTPGTLFPCFTKYTPNSLPLAPCSPAGRCAPPPQPLVPSPHGMTTAES